jgi:ABC-type branched-subunit amino acid transport system ATPase component
LLQSLLVDSVFETFKDIFNAGTTTRMVEQNVKRSLEISDHGVGLGLGYNRFEGSGEEQHITKTYVNTIWGLD